MPDSTTPNQSVTVSPALRLGEAATGAVVPPAQTAVRAAEQTLELDGESPDAHNLIGYIHAANVQTVRTLMNDGERRGDP